ncbi:MAG: PAS domain S-box protein [Desulfobulbaceae bacterium]|nr:PAS domain S-box protein [Desulfobulbaceae bacterium]
MRNFQNLSIRTKLTMLLLSLSTVAVLAATLAFYLLVIDQYRQSYRKDLDSLTGILAANCQASLAFQIPEDAEQLLESLKNRPSVIAARIETADGKLFASYGIRMSGPEIISVSHAIEMNGKVIGNISLQDDMRSLLAFRQYALLTLILIVLLVSGLSFFLAARLRELISQPITELAEVAKEISRNQNYRLRAEKHGTDEVGNLVDSFNGMLAQIAERSDALSNSERRYRALLNQAADAFLLHDLAGRIVDVNQRACDSLGYNREALLSMSVADIELQVENRHDVNFYWQSLQPEQSLTVARTHRRKDGMTYPVEVRVGLLELGGERLIIALARDISERMEAEKERNQMEERLRQSQKMESIGTLAGGIAHDFNNILTPIFGYLELAMMEAQSDLTTMSHLEKVYQAAGRAKELVKQILTFSRRDTEEQSPVLAQVVIKEALKLLRASIPTTIEIRQDIDPSCPPVMANPTQIHQILMNLCTNAYHAMQATGGILGVSLTPLEITVQDYLKNLNLKPGHYLRLEVSDTGCGMDRETLDRALEPYFTTKPKNEGTGMGLSVVHGIVKGYGGNIGLYSEPGKGTTIRIYLPATALPPTHQPMAIQTNVTGGNERIMLVDDELAVRGVEKAMLESLGYKVSDFGDSLEAIAAFTATPNQFDLLVTDMTMPKLTGDRLAEKILEIRPDLPIIICTGFSQLINRESALAMGIKDLVTKPLVRHDFASTIRAVLDGKSSE